MYKPKLPGVSRFKNEASIGCQYHCSYIQTRRQRRVETLEVSGRGAILAGEEKGRQARMAPKPIKSNLETLISLPVLENPVERGSKERGGGNLTFSRLYSPVCPLGFRKKISIEIDLIASRSGRKFQGPASNFITSHFNEISNYSC